MREIAGIRKKLEAKGSGKFKIPPINMKKIIVFCSFERFTSQKNFFKKFRTSSKKVYNTAIVKRKKRLTATVFREIVKHVNFLQPRKEGDS